MPLGLAVLCIFKTWHVAVAAEFLLLLTVAEQTEVNPAVLGDLVGVPALFHTLETILSE